MSLIPKNMPHIPRMKNTNLEARLLKEDVFRKIAVGPMCGEIDIPAATRYYTIS